MTAAPTNTTTIPARDGYQLAATIRTPADSRGRVVVISSAMAVKRGFYDRLADYFLAAGYTVITYDYRGIGGSRKGSLRGFEATLSDWALLDMQGVIEWTTQTLHPDRLFLFGHSAGGQLAGMIADPTPIDAMVTVASQSGYWRIQGKGQRMVVAFHSHVALPGLPKIFGYMPWSRISKAEDIPKGVSEEWARWIRSPDYLLGDDSLPLDRYSRFTAPVLAYSLADDTWGTREAVNAMMSAYPNVERRHVEPSDIGVESIGHFGFFRPESKPLWDDVVTWLETH
ncbi:Hydrolases of the alpha/beta superfamily [hydrothermal vent metagenome]|uniref:Hydrolases of the alpha/beta superfamily n=1 Tax=hydrothermal vent metagenome TaxID=652676 RepID=A0A3B0SJ53_9ZZZZ